MFEEEQFRTRWMAWIMAIILLIFFAFLLGGCSNKNKSQKVEIYDSIDDLEGHTIGICMGTICDTIAEATWKSPKLEYYTSFADLTIALSSHKIDAYINDDLVAFVQERENDRITHMDTYITREEFGFIFAKTEEAATLRDELNGFMAELRANGTLDKMLELWIQNDASERPEIDLASLTADNGVIHLATNAVTPPMIFLEEGEFVGYELDILYRFCVEKGYGLEISEMDFASVIPGVTMGKYDLACCMISITEERAESVYFSDPDYIGGEVVMINKENSPEYHSEGTSGFSFSSLKDSFDKTFVRESRWRLFLSGIGTTLLITVLTILFGSVLGFSLYMWCHSGGKIANRVTGFFVWLIQGMPVVVLLMILFYIIFGSSTLSGTWVSVIAFSLVFGMSVCEIVRSGVKAVDAGQMEAALALGYSPMSAFFKMILPQAAQYFMPAYKAEIVSLVKATAVVGYVAVMDVTKTSDLIRSRTYEAFFPLIVTAVLYFLLAAVLTRLTNFIQVRIIPTTRSKKQILKGVKTND